MPKISPNAQEQSESKLSDRMEERTAEMQFSTKPVLTCGVNRKINTGNFENIDIYAALTIPLDSLPGTPEELQQLVEEAAEVGFSLMSKETGDRYDLIREMQKGRKS